MMGRAWHTRPAGRCHPSCRCNQRRTLPALGDERALSGTGVIERACRYLAEDRMERTGARWSLHGAEAVLRLRALWTNGDFEPYEVFHLHREHERHATPACVA